MFKKILLATVAIFFIFIGAIILSVGYFYNHPEKFFNAFQKVTDRILEGKKYEETEEFFLQGIDEISFQSENTDVFIETYSSEQLKIEITGNIPEFVNGPFINTRANRNLLNIIFIEPAASSWIRWNVNGEEISKKSNAQLQAHIYLPENYKDKIELSTSEGRVHLRLAKTSLYELEIRSDSGNISNNLQQDVASADSQKAGHITIKTKSGSVLAESF